MSLTYARPRKRTHLAIMEATIELLHEPDRKKLTITAIADRADVGRGTFYRYFDDVDAVLFAIFTHYFDLLDAEIQAVMARHESPDKERYAWRAVFSNTKRLFPTLQRIRQVQSDSLQVQLADTMTKRFRQSLEKGNFAYPQWMDLPIDVMTYFSAGAVNNIIQHWLNGELDYDSDTLGDMVWRLLYHAPIKGDEGEK